eukprot:1354742-Heterocapsa_arctica.AAC.2
MASASSLPESSAIRGPRSSPISVSMSSSQCFSPLNNSVIFAGPWRMPPCPLPCSPNTSGSGGQSARRQMGSYSGWLTRS